MNAPVVAVESPHKILAQQYLRKWGKEIELGRGAPNILAVFERLGDGDPAFHISPGPMFTPMSQRTDRILRDLRAFDKRLASLLVAYALDFSHQSIANANGSNKSAVQQDLREAFGAFSTALFYITLHKFTPERRPRKALAEDLGL